MSDFVQKTLGTLSTLFGNVPVGSDDGSKRKARSAFCFDRATFISKLKSTTSKKEQEAVVNSFLCAAEKQLSQPNATESQIENCLHLVMCCESLGYSAPFIYMHAIKLAQKGNLKQKNTGYLASAALLHPQHELIILLVNSIQKDLESSNYAEVMLGLKSVCNLINADTVHNVLYLVQERLFHEKVEVRKLAALALNHCLTLVNSQSAYSMALPKLERLLTDSDLSVVSSVIPVIYNIVKNCPGSYEYLVESLIQVQSQLLHRQCPRHMIYHSIPAPWLQIKILKFLSFLCKDNTNSQMVLPILKTTLQQAEVNHNIAYAIISEVIETIVSIVPNKEMIHLALSSASKFLKSDDGNLKYVGVQEFSIIMQKVKPTLDTSHQESIIACLNHPDDMLKTKTLELLYNLANSSNAQAVCKKLVEFMICRTDVDSKKDLGLKVLRIANQYNTDSLWYLSTVNSVLLEVGNVIPQTKISQIIDSILQDTSGALKTFAKQTYLDMCKNTCPPTCIIKIISSIFDQPSEFEEILPRLISEADDTSILWLLVSLRNQVMITKKISVNLCSVLKSQKYASNTLQQICSEILNLAEGLACVEDKPFLYKMDPTLSFLDSYICQSLLNGSSCYKPAELRVTEFPDEAFAQPISLQPGGNAICSNIEDYDDTKTSSNPLTPSYSSFSSSSLSTLSQKVPYVPKKRAVWTKEGRVKKDVCANSHLDSTGNTAPCTPDDELFAGLL